MKSSVESIWSSKERLGLCRTVSLCSVFLLWMGVCMQSSNANYPEGGAESHKIAKRVVATYSPFPHPRVSSHLEDNQLNDNFLTTPSAAEASRLAYTTGKVAFPHPTSRHPSQIVFPESSFRFPSDSNVVDRTRVGRTLPGQQNARDQEVSASSTPPIIHIVGPPPQTHSDSESSRKASPDVQDIIDGIVKLLGGRVHNTQTQQTQQQPIQHSVAPPTQTLQQQRQEQQLLQSQRPYNLFNPNKPIYYNTPTSKPTRINNRGPPLPTQLTLGPPINPNIHRNPPIPMTDPQSTFEAIPLEALNSGFNLTQTKFGPPFSLTKVIPGAEAPYKQGIPLPEQLVPLPPNHQQQQPTTGNGNHHPYNINFNLNPKPSGNNGNQQQTPNSNHGFFANSQGENYSPNSPPKQPEQSGESGNQNGEKVPPLWSNAAPPSHIRPEYNAPKGDSHRKNPGTIVNFANNNNGETTTTAGTTTTTSGTGLRVSTPPTTLLVPLTTASTSSELDNGKSSSPQGTKSPPRIQTQVQTDSIEDDEADVEKEDRKILKNIQNSNASVVEILEASTTGNSIWGSEPSSVSRETTMRTIFEFSTFSSKSSSSSSVISEFKIQPTTSSSIYSTIVQTSSTNAWGFDFLPSTVSVGSSHTGMTSYPPIPPRIPAEIQPNGMTRPTPALRPGIVIHEGSPSPTPPIPIPGGNQGYGSVEVVSPEGTGGKIGETFDITVTAKQNYAGQATGQPFVIPVDVKDEIITAPEGNQQFVSIDGKRTYFNLHPSTAAGIGMGGQTKMVTHLPMTTSTTPAIPSHPGIVGIPSHPFAKPPSIVKNTNGPSRAVSTSLSINSGTKPSSSSSSSSLSLQGGLKTPPNLVRRPATRRPPIVQSVRIDTCIVGDDSTCNAEQFEICRTESGVSSCLCRAGYARRRHREPCKAITSLILSIRLDKLGDKKLSYNADYFNQNSEIYQSLEWETIHGLDSIMSETNLQHSYVGAKLDAVGFDGRHAVVNSTVLIQENAKTPINQVTKNLQAQITQVLTKNRNNFGKSQLWVESPTSAISSVTDVNECENQELHDCDSKANCLNTFGSFECRCEFGYGDPFENVPRKSGRTCESCNGKTHCNGRGECQIEEGQKVCKCAGNFYGSQCDIDGEVLAVAIGASVSALVIIGLTLACLCLWSRRWKREEQKAALMSRTLFGGMASQALSYLSKNSMNTTNPYQQHITLDERLRWAQVAEANMNGNIYVNEPLSMHTNPGLLGPGSMMETPPMMSARRSADTCDTTVDDLFEERHPTKRPKSRSSQMQSGIYYDLEPEPQSEIYGTRAPTIMSYPAQFCVPMNPYPHSRGFYN